MDLSKIGTHQHSKLKNGGGVHQRKQEKKFQNEPTSKTNSTVHVVAFS
jgi:hypothetical protein